MREIKNTAEVSLTIRLLTFTMYFSSPHLLCLQAATPRSNREFKNRQKQLQQHPNCALCLQKINLHKGVSKKGHYQWCIWRQQPDFDPTDYGWAGKRMRYPSLNSPSLSLLRLLQHQITCSIHQMFLFFGEFI